MNLSNPSQSLHSPAQQPEPAASIADPGQLRRRNGHVARLPKVTRDKINRMLDDGVSYSEIIANLGDDGRSLTKVNLCNWKSGGYQDWLREQRLLEQSRAGYELTLDIAQQTSGLDTFQAAHKLAATLICHTIAEFGADTLRQACAANPLNMLRMLNALSRLTLGGLRCEQHLASHPDARLRDKGGITPETLKKIQEELNLL